MKFILFMILITNGTTMIDTEEFNSLEACEAAGAKLISEIKKNDEYHIGTGSSRTWCIEKGLPGE